MDEKIPMLYQKEKDAFIRLSSLDFSTAFNKGKPNLFPHRQVVFKGARWLEAKVNYYLEKEESGVTLTAREQVDIFNVFSKLGHLSLLAQDFARAFYAYQNALKRDADAFGRHPANHYGLGLTCLFFHHYHFAADCLRHVLYAHPASAVLPDVHVRLGVCYKALEQFDDAVKHFSLALNDSRACAALTKPQLRFNIALCYDNAGQLEKAQLEYDAILRLESAPQEPHGATDAVLLAAVYRQLAFLIVRKDAPAGSDQRANDLKQMENFLNHSNKLEGHVGKTFYYLGRCYGELPNKAHDAFANYRMSIDKCEADADTWCSIGVLYQQQNQPLDALQAFICAVELDPEHSPAWTNLAGLYENHFQFRDALECLRKAVSFKPTAPEPLKQRVQVLEKELAVNSILSQQRVQSQHMLRLPPLTEAWNQPIPSELRQRQNEFLRQKQQRIREGSVVWRMGELAVSDRIFTRVIIELQHDGLTAEQIQLMRLLRANRTRLHPDERVVLEKLEQQHNEGQAKPGDSGTESADDDKPSTSGEQVAFITRADLTRVLDDEAKADAEGAQSRTSVWDTPPSADESSSSSAPSELPASFSLLAPIQVPLDMTAREVLEQAGWRHDRPRDFRPLFHENVAPPHPPPAPKLPLSEKELSPPTPLIYVESSKDAHCPELHNFCYSSPITLIRGLTSVLKLDLSLFSTKTLLETVPDHEVEIRTQYKMTGDANVDQLGRPTWQYYSHPGHSDVYQYAQYQAQSFKASLKEETEKLRVVHSKGPSSSEGVSRKRGRTDDHQQQQPSTSEIPMKTLKFGTNVDLSDEAKFRSQLGELAKLPAFCRLVAGCNLLSHLGHIVLGMNTVQLYMKVPGSRTPAHRENNALASVNINIGPGDCEWFGVPNDYWGQISDMCKQRGINFLRGSWWPDASELRAAGIPVYKFTQKAGDMVWVGGGCVHWVQATGWCNNIAWNVGPITYDQLSLAIHSYEYNRLEGYKSLVPMQHLAWQLAKNVQVTNSRVYTLVREMLIRSLANCRMVVSYLESRGKTVQKQPRADGEPAHYCTACDVEVWNVLLVKEAGNQQFAVYCVDCARRHSNFDVFHVLQQITFDELAVIYDGFRLHSIPKLNLIC